MDAQSFAPAEFTIEGPIDRFTTDELGNCYILQGDELTLYSPKGERLAQNSVKTLGTINVIDAFYSLRPVLFSREQQQLASLDNTLSIQNAVINLPQNGWPQVTLACASVQNAFWFYDQQEMSLTRVDRQLRNIASTGRLDQLLGWVPEPDQMMEFDGWLYVNDPQHGLIVLDLFGNYYKTIPIEKIEQFEVRTGEILFFSQSKFMRYDLLSFATMEIPLPYEKVVSARVERGLLYTHTSNGLQVHRVKVVGGVKGSGR